MFKRSSFIYLFFILTFVIGGCSVDQESVDGIPLEENSSKSNSTGGVTSTGNPGQEGQNSEEEPANQSEGGGSSSSHGNPLSFSLKGAKALVLLTNQSDSSEGNIKRIVDGKLEDVITSTESDKDSAPILIPQVEEFYTGPQQTAVFLFDEPMILNGVECQFVKYSEGDLEADCIDETVSTLDRLDTPQNAAEIPGGHQPVQFDLEGNIYYSSHGELTKWNREALSLEAILPYDFLIEDFLIGDFGQAIYRGEDPAIHEQSLQYRNIEGITYSISDDEIYHFDLLSFSELFLASDRLAIATVESSKITAIDPLEIPWRDDISVVDIQKNDGEETFALIRDESLMTRDRLIYKIYPGEPQFIRTLVRYPHFFRIVGNRMFVVGSTSEGVSVLTEIRLDTLEERTLVSGIGIKKINGNDEILYAIGTDMSDRSIVRLGIIPLAESETGFSEILYNLDRPIIDLQFLSE